MRASQTLQSTQNTFDPLLQLNDLQSLFAQQPCRYHHYNFTPAYKNKGGGEEGSAKRQQNG